MSIDLEHNHTTDTGARLVRGASVRSWAGQCVLICPDPQDETRSMVFVPTTGLITSMPTEQLDVDGDIAGASMSDDELITSIVAAWTAAATCGGRAG